MKAINILIKKIFSKTLTYKLYNTITSLFYYIRDYLYISDTFYSDEFKLVLKKYLNINIKKDWIGRLYGIINPNIDINGDFNVNNVIIELDGENSNNNEYVKTWAYKQLNLISSLFKIQKLYDYISLEFNHVGPENADNYLLIFDITNRKEFVYWLKKLFKHLFIYSIIVIIIYFILKFGYDTF